EHWRQTLTIITSICLPLLIFLGILWNDHSQVARNADDISRLVSTSAAHEKQITRIEDRIEGMSSTESTLGTKLDTLSGGVNQLTLAVQKLTDLLPERKAR
ncbi:MAG TPA: hypothetical protein VGR40_12800, partial [Candidatus Binatus sp.]|nr:hypothetical protein [Candidatus Binatus sp.]